MLDADALADYTQGRLAADDPVAETVLAAALAEVRRWCGWHVTPERDDDLVIDGPGSQVLRLPTLRLVALTEVTEDGTAVDVAGLEWSRLGLVRKTSGRFWTPRMGGVAVTITHGFDDAEDFESAVLSVADRRFQAAFGKGGLSAIGPFQFSDDRSGASAFGGSAAAPFNAVELSILEQYRLERPA